MQTHELRYFLATARTLNFTKAATMCGISQPALTRAIKKLESELGGPLFHRRPGNVELTRLGRTLLPRLEEIERGLAEVQSQASALADEQSISLRLGVMCTVGPIHIVDILRKLREKTSDVDVSIQDVRADAVVELLLADEIDVGITAQPSLPEGIALQPLLDERYVVALPDGHPLAAGAAVELAQLEGQSDLERLSCEFDAHFEAVHGNWPFEFNVTYASEREDWIQALIAAGQGCAILPENMQCAPGIVTRPLTGPEVRRTIGLATLRGRQLPEVAQRFLRIAASHRWSGARE